MNFLQPAHMANINARTRIVWMSPCPSMTMWDESSSSLPLVLHQSCIDIQISLTWRKKQILISKHTSICFISIHSSWYSIRVLDMNKKWSEPYNGSCMLQWQCQQINITHEGFSINKYHVIISCVNENHLPSQCCAYAISIITNNILRRVFFK